MTAPVERGPVRRIAVVSGGVTGWSAAAAFARRLPGVEVVVVADPTEPPALVDLLPCAPPSAATFHTDIGLEEAALLAEADALFRLGTAFERWTPGDRYLHAYGDHGAPLGPAPFHLQWLAAGVGRGAFSDYSPAAALAQAGRFTHPAQDPRSPLAGFGYGYQLDPARYAALLRASALAAGAREARGPAEAEIAGGRVVALRTADGGRLEPDVVVDTQGALADRLEDRFESWEAWLPGEEVLVASASAAPDPPPADRVVADAHGWALAAPLRGRTVHAHVHPRSGAAPARKALAARTGGAEPVAVALRQGRRSAAWVGNVVAVGAAAVAVEPLEAAPLHLVHAHVDRIVAALPGRDCDPVEIADYNRQTAAEADRLRDFLALHYLLADRPEPFWRKAAAAEPPESLSQDLALFRERGRLPVHDGETFARDSWVQVLLGQGVVPRRPDALASLVPQAAALARMQAMRAELAAAAARAPRHGDYVTRLLAARR